MTSEKFIYEVTTVTKFIQIYCDGKHADAPKKDGAVLHNYKDDKGLVRTQFHLCADCERMLRYASAHRKTALPPLPASVLRARNVDKYGSHDEIQRYEARAYEDQKAFFV